MSVIAGKIYCEVPNVFGVYRGPRPTSKRDIEIGGWTTIINLQCDSFEVAQVAEEKAWCQELSVKFIHLPMSMFTPPDSEQIQKAINAIKSSINVLVHCYQGVDRTGLVIASYRMVYQNWTYGKAIGEMLDAGFHLDRYFWWLPLVKLK